jgi:N-glycosylase/DNA lyase
MGALISAGEIPVSIFDLRHTFESAQPLTFHADYNSGSNSILYTCGNTIVNVGQSGGSKSGKLVVVSKETDFAVRDVVTRFRVKDDMKKIYKTINTDRFIDESIRRYYGMRLTVNDPWETTLCFIISQFNNVKRIRKIVRALKERYGQPIKDDAGRTMAYAFPESKDMIDATVKELMVCGTGFRAKYIKHAAEYCTNNLDLYKLNPNDYQKIRDSLMEIHGVGEKVADCIALMGYGNTEAFPIDVWVKRTMEKVYFKGRKKTAKQLHKFADEKYGKYKGYFQQYLFWAGRQMDEEIGAYI